MRTLVILTLLLSAAPAGAARLGALTRTALGGDVAHESVILTLDDTLHGKVRLHRVVRERAPFVPRRTAGAVVLLHGDFSDFDSNFLAMAEHLAARGLDVWGIDRRWTTAVVGDDLTDFAEMGFAAAIADTETALLYVRALRLVTGGDAGRVFLGGFSRGGHLAYATAAEDATRPAAARQLRGLVVLDMLARYPAEDEELRLAACARAEEERGLVAAGVVSENAFFQDLGAFALAAPEDPSPIFEGFTNRLALVGFAAQTYFFYAPTPVYHQAGGVFDGDLAVGLRYSTEQKIAAWLAGAPPLQTYAEIADSDASWCEGSLALEAITVPLLHVAAAGGFGDRGAYAASVVGSSDATVLAIRRLPSERELEDFGHADVLFADDAREWVWDPVAWWILARSR